ncbi:MAG: hypothetical protein H0V74_09890 [Chloroflexi bacterium]|nr:hypothetical protein [Chloroflexota bacterium]
MAAIVLVVATGPATVEPAGALPPTLTPLRFAPTIDPDPWTSITWRQVERPFAAEDPTPRQMVGLAAGNGFVVGWGQARARGRNQFDSMGAVIVSRDGERWRVIPLDDGVGVADASEPHGVAFGPTGVLVHGGVCCTVEEAAVWRSIDGSAWSRLPLGGDFDRRADTFNRIVGVNDGWVGVGVSSGRPAIWTSLDGGTWRAVDGLDVGKGTISDVATFGDRLIAVGTIDDDAATHDGGVWGSDDGTTWTRVARADPTLTGGDETELWRIVPFAGGLFVVGNHGSHEERVQCEQLGMTADLDPGPPATAFSCGWGREHHWLSADADSWLRLQPFDPLPGQPAPPGVRPIEHLLLAASGPGLVNYAEDSRPTDDAGVWVSPDGRTWQQVLSLVGEPPSAPYGFAVLGRRVVLVGDGDPVDGVQPEVRITIGIVQ